MNKGRHDSRFVPTRARAVAGELASLFEEDNGLVVRLNEVSRRLAGANRWLWSGLHPDAIALLYDKTDGRTISSGTSVIAEVMGDAMSGGGDDFDAETAVLPVLQEAHWTIHRAFADHQLICEERRQIAVRVGELSQQLVDVLAAVGWPADAARAVNVHELAAAGM